MKLNFQPTVQINYCADENTTRALAMNDALIELLAVISKSLAVVEFSAIVIGVLSSQDLEKHVGAIPCKIDHHVLRCATI